MTKGRIRRGLMASAALGGLIGVPVLSGVAAAAVPKTVAITVDWTPPAGHNFEYTDFFPRAAAQVHIGDVVKFQWAAMPDGLHTATLLKNGVTPDQEWQNVQLAVADQNDRPGTLQLNPAFGPTNPPPGSGAPGECGDSAHPCVYTGSDDLNSGPSPTDGTSTFFAKINAPVGTTVNFVCLIHPGMAGSLEVVPKGQATAPQSLLDLIAGNQATADTNGALAAEAAVSTAAVKTNPDGKTRTHTVAAGTHSDHVEVAEFLPQDVHVQPGDTVDFVSMAGVDPHTITFPSHTEDGEPLPNVCDRPGGDVELDPSVPGPPCGDPSTFETHLVVAPGGATSITSPTTFGTSGILIPPGAGVPLPDHYAFQFPKAGTFTYFCHIHENQMVGTVSVG